MTDLGTGSKVRSPRFALFAYGFRPFFLAAGVYAVIAIAAWLWIFSYGKATVTVVPPAYWHGHEMIFGFVVAAVTGFLLTAVPSWTGRRGFAGIPLVLLALLWLAARLTFLLIEVLPWSVVIVAELALVPALLVTIGPSLLRTVDRNTPLLLLLLALWGFDIVFLYGSVKQEAALMSAALRAALDLVLVLITIIGGRIVPAFTRNALRAAGRQVDVTGNRALEKAIVPVMLVLVVSDVIAPFGATTALVAMLAAVMQLWRLSRWGGLHTAAMPIVWVLHVAYLWLPAGLALKAVNIAAPAPWAAHWQHALAAGAAATMIMAVMTRASLGHTGRQLRVPTAITWAYVLLTLAVLTRVIGPAVLPLGYGHTVLVAGALWLASFGVFVTVYAPILILPRVDGRPG